MVDKVDKMNNPRLNDTVLAMIAFHGDQMDKSGVPYFYHPLRVLTRLAKHHHGASEDECIAALLHDVIEDTDVTFETLREMGYQEGVLTLLDLLTKREDESHGEYMLRIIKSNNLSALRVKLADLHDNSNITRANACADEKVRQTILSMIESRYIPAIAMVRIRIIQLGGDPDDIWSGDVDIELEEIEHDN